MGRDGLLVDADNDGTPGGIKQADFRTLPLTLIPGTEVWGYIYDLYNKAPTETLPIQVPNGDPQFDPMATGTQTIPFTWAEFFPGTGTAASDPRLQSPNKISSFIDASMVYGSNETVARVRCGGSMVRES
ncbi:MAG: peroxidase family protein [Pirellulaceae bacterium]